MPFKFKDYISVKNVQNVKYCCLMRKRFHIPHITGIFLKKSFFSFFFLILRVECIKIPNSAKYDVDSNYNYFVNYECEILFVSLYPRVDNC